MKRFVPHLLRAGDIALAAVTLLFCAVTVWQTVFLNAAGGVLTAAAVAERCARFAWLPWLWIAAAVLTLTGHAVFGDETEKYNDSPARPADAPAPGSGKRAGRILLAAGVILIGIGIAVGGASQIMARAIIICSECIGLG